MGRPRKKYRFCAIIVGQGHKQTKLMFYGGVLGLTEILHDFIRWFVSGTELSSTLNEFEYTFLHIYDDDDVLRHHEEKLPD